MNSRMKQLSVSAIAAITLLLCSGLQAQNSTTGDNGKVANTDPQPVAVYTVMPPSTPKSASLSVLPLPTENGNKPEELNTFTQNAAKWAKENPDAFNSLDQETKDLFNNGKYEVLMNKVKDLQNTKK